MRDGGVEDPERVRERHAVEHVEVVAVPRREHRRGEVAEAVHRQDRRLLERRDEERARDVRLMVLDVVDRRSEIAAFDTERSRDVAAHVVDLRHVAQPRRDVAGVAEPARRLADLGTEVRARVAADRDVVELARIEPRVAQAPRSRQRREAGHVLDAVETLFLGRRDELAVDHEGRRRIAVKGVEPQDRGHVARDASRSVASVL